jgi:hypothetical protein
MRTVALTEHPSQRAARTRTRFSLLSFFILPLCLTDHRCQWEL